MWLDSQNIHTKQPSKKLDHQRLGPYPITAKISLHAFHVGLPLALCQVHPIFHVSLLKLVITSTIPGWYPDPPPPTKVHSKDEYKVANIINSHIWQNQLEYLVEWKGYEHISEATSWESLLNVVNSA